MRCQPHLVIPPIGAGSDLNTTFQIVRSTQEVVAKIREVIGSRIVETDHEESVVDDVQARFIVLVAGESLPETRPDLAIFRGQHANRVARYLESMEERCCESEPLHSEWGLSATAHLMNRHLVCIRDDRLQIPENLSFRKHGPVLSVKDVEPVYTRIPFN